MWVNFNVSLGSCCIFKINLEITTLFYYERSCRQQDRAWGCVAQWTATHLKKKGKKRKSKSSDKEIFKGLCTGRVGLEFSWKQLTRMALILWSDRWFKPAVPELIYCPWEKTMGIPNGKFYEDWETNWKESLTYLLCWCHCVTLILKTSGEFCQVPGSRE